jgi:hypothetical protein
VGAVSMEAGAAFMEAVAAASDHDPEVRIPFLAEPSG